MSTADPGNNIIPEIKPESTTASIIQPGGLPRSPFVIDRNTFSMIFKLTEEQPWLKEKQTALINLFEDCSEYAQQALLTELLYRFTFLDHKSFYEAVDQIADFIQVKMGLTPENCLISGSDYSMYADSADLVVYQLKSAKWKSQEWTTNCFVSSLTALAEKASAGHLVLVDEFIGSGDSSIKRVKWLKSKLPKSMEPPKIYYAAIAAMEGGASLLKEHVDEVFSAYTLKRGISDYYSERDAEYKKEVMVGLEKTLSSVGKRGKLKDHTLGYKKTESLYSRARGNTPNNVFPVFWWEKKYDNSSREAILSCM